MPSTEENRSMVNDFILSLRRDVSVNTGPGKAIILQWHDSKWTLNNVSDSLQKAIEILAGQGCPPERLAAVFHGADGCHKLDNFDCFFDRLTQLGLLSYTLTDRDAALATVVPTASESRFDVAPAPTDRHYVLSRFAYLRRENDHLILDSPLAQGEIIIHDFRAGNLVLTLARPCLISELADEYKDLCGHAVTMFLSVLYSMGIVEPDPPPDAADDTTGTALQQWDFHDLLFHCRTRRGKHARPSGVTGRFLGKIPPLPAVKEPMSEAWIDLYRPDLEKLKSDDLSFTRVVEDRKSVRHFSNKPLPGKKLGEFLFRSARIRREIQAEFMEVTNRPYPCAGAVYELEIYVLLNLCDTLPPGLYRYAPLNHRLEKVTDRNAGTEQLVLDAGRSMATHTVPQALIIYAARFQRIAWKYESIAYQLILKDVGVIMQNMSLVSTAMGLASCILGNGNSDLFARAAGTDYYVETSVGEFALGL